MPQVVFLSLFLGLVTGIQSVDLRVDPEVKSVRIELGGREVARLPDAPWSAKVDFGKELIPRELTAIGYDAKGVEIARASQPTNLSPPSAQLEIVIRSEGKRPVEAELIGRHRIHRHPEVATLLVDGTPVKVEHDFHAQLPPLDWSRPHVLSAEMRFEDDVVARRDLATEGGNFSGSTGTELAPVLVSLTGKQPENAEGCFSSGGTTLRVSAIEKANALVIMVKDPDSRDLIGRLKLDAGRPELKLDPDATERILWPISKAINAPGEPIAIAFLQSVDRTPSESARKGPTIPWLLTLGISPRPNPNEPRQYADAVAVAGMNARERGQRRAVVLLLSRKPDQSLYAPAIIRRYLEEVGVPLLVWSADGPRPDLAGSWGPVDDVSTVAGLDAATAKLNQLLAQQRIVWIAADPLTALHAESAERCGLTPVARHRSLVPAM